MNKLVVFDCDGTLVDSQAAIIRAMEGAFAQHGLQRPHPHATRRVVGLSLVQAMHRLLPEADADLHHKMAESYKQAFRDLRTGGEVDEPLFPGIAELLTELEARGYLLGVATGKSDRGLAACLDHHGLAERFATLQTADRHPSKPHPAMLHAAIAEAGAAPETTVMIGDTSFDILMGKSAGTLSVGVTWGYHDAADLQEAGAHHIIHDAGALLTLLD